MCKLRFFSLCWFHLQIIFTATDFRGTHMPYGLVRRIHYKTRLIQSCVHSPITWLHRRPIFIMHVLTPGVSRQDTTGSTIVQAHIHTHTLTVSWITIWNHNICVSHFSLKMSAEPPLPTRSRSEFINMHAFCARIMNREHTPPTIRTYLLHIVVRMARHMHNCTRVRQWVSVCVCVSDVPCTKQEN